MQNYMQKYTFVKWVVVTYTIKIIILHDRKDHNNNKNTRERERKSKERGIERVRRRQRGWNEEDTVELYKDHPSSNTVFPCQEMVVSTTWSNREVFRSITMLSHA